MGSVVENPKKVVGAEPGNSLVAGTSPDGKWTLPIQGGRLHRGCNKSPGRPKKEIRDLALKGANKAVEDDLKTLNDPNSTDEAKEKARDRLYRYGLGTKDEVEIADARSVLQAVATSLAKLDGRTLSPQVAAEAIRDAMEALGIS